MVDGVVIGTVAQQRYSSPFAEHLVKIVVLRGHPLQVGHLELSGWPRPSRVGHFSKQGHTL